MKSSLQLAAVMLAATLCLGASAQVAPVQRGPAPTVQSLEAALGPLAVSSAKVQSPAGYGAATVYYPTATDQGVFGLVVLAPGFLGAQSYYAWLAERVASHGFVVASINTNSIFDSPSARTPQITAALNQVLALSKVASTPYAGKVDPARLALMGHSAGGGGAMAAALAAPTLKAVVALTPAHTIKDYSSLRVPTLVLAGEKDVIAPNSSYSRPMFASFDAALSSAYIEVAGADHLGPTFLGTTADKAAMGKYTIAWLKRFVDGDVRYTPFVRPAVGGDVSRYESRGTF